MDPYSQNVFEPEVYNRVRTYGLRSDPIPNKHLVDLYQMNVEERNYNLAMNSPNVVPKKTETFLK
jgi:hypothetical protein